MDKGQARKLLDDLSQFKKTDLYKYLLKSRQDAQWKQIEALINAGANSNDDVVRRLAQEIQREAILWADLIEIEASGQEAKASEEAERKPRYGSYEVPA